MEDYPPTTKICPTCGARRRIPRSNGTFVEQAAYVGTTTRYQVRAHLDLGPPVIVHPFAISEIGAFGRKPGFRWQTGPRVCTLLSPEPLYTFEDAEKFLKSWAEGYIASALRAAR
jgi:hypothetical protein